MTAQAMGQASYFYNQHARRQHRYFHGLDGVDGLKDALEPTNAFVVDWANIASPPLISSK